MYSRIKEARKALSLSQTEFGDKLGLTQQSIASIEQGKTPVSDKHIKPICAIYNVNENWLRTGMGDMFIDNASISHFNDLYNGLNDANKRLIENIIDAMLSQQDGEEG